MNSDWLSEYVVVMGSRVACAIMALEGVCKQLRSPYPFAACSADSAYRASPIRAPQC